MGGDRLRCALVVLAQVVPTMAVAPAWAVPGGGNGRGGGGRGHGNGNGGQGNGNHGGGPPAWAGGWTAPGQLRQANTGGSTSSASSIPTVTSTSRPVVAVAPGRTTGPSASRGGTTSPSGGGGGGSTASRTRRPAPRRARTASAGAAAGTLIPAPTPALRTAVAAGLAPGIIPAPARIVVPAATRRGTTPRFPAAPAMLTLAVPAARIAAEIGPSSRRVIPEELWIGLGALLLLATLGTLAAVCNGVRLRRQHAQLVRLREAARTDALAGLLNRRGFIEEAERELARAQRHDRPFTLAYADVRGLKGVNDTLGHQAGDRLLQAVSWLLRESARAGDTVGRLGGDELGLLLVEQGPEGAASVHRRIQELVDARRRTLWARIGVGRDDRPGDVPRRWNDGARTARACRSPALRSARDHGRAGLRG